MSGVLKAACVQVNAGTELEPNLRAAGDLVRRATDALKQLALGWL